MNPLVAFKVAIAALRLNALRSFLAMLGVIIGVASVIVMVSVASGAGQAIEARIKSLGTNLLVISPGSYTSGGRRSGGGTAEQLSESDLDALRERSSWRRRRVRRRAGSAPIIYGGTNWTASVDGVNLDYLEVRDWELAEGRNFTEQELRSAAKVAILGATTARELFGDDPVIGQDIRIMNVPFTVVGLLSPKGQTGFGMDQDDTAHRAGHHRPPQAVRRGEDRERQSPPHPGRGGLRRRDGRRAGRDRKSAAATPARAGQARWTISRCGTWPSSSAPAPRRRASSACCSAPPPPSR